MSDELEIERDDDSDGIKQLRAALKAANKKAKDAEAAAGAATKSLADRQLADVLTAKKLSPKIARFITADGVDASDSDAVEKWLTENAEDLGFSLEAVTPAEPNVSPEDQAAFGQMQQPQFQSPVQKTKADEVNRQAEEFVAKGDTDGLMKLFAGSGI